MPNKWTFKMKSVQGLLSKYNVGCGWADPFCGESVLCELRNDLNPENKNAQTHFDALSFMKNIPDGFLNGVLFDPPYSMEQVKRSYNSVGITEWQKIGNNKNGSFSAVKDEIKRAIKTGGTVISFGWNSSGMGIKRGFVIEEIMLIAHGPRNDTIVTVERYIK
jgi:hypothetical protein